MAVPDWPASFGNMFLLLSRMTGGIYYEQMPIVMEPSWGW